jgi:hypothetical protein
LEPIQLRSNGALNNSVPACSKGQQTQRRPASRVITQGRARRCASFPQNGIVVSAFSSPI